MYDGARHRHIHLSNQRLKLELDLPPNLENISGDMEM